MNTWIAISITLLAGYTTLMIFYLIGWRRTKIFSAPENSSPKTKVSVIIAARNEELNIEKCVRSILNQDYPKELLEVIVVDDHSLIPTPSPKEEGVRTLSLRSDAQGKKAAIAFGIQHSTGELIITTDSDCIAGEKWISTVVAYYEKFQPKMIAAPVAFSDEKSFLEKWQSLDLCGMMVITAGAISNGFPNLCNGANLAYQKKVFVEVGGFSGIDKQPSGDDVMMMMKIAKEYPNGIHFLKSQEAIVYTQTEQTLSGLFQQRLRWLSKGTAFPDWRVSAVLIFSWLFNVSILVNLIAGFFQKEFWIAAGASVIIKTLVELPLLWSGCLFFGKGYLLLFLLPAQAVHLLYVTVVGFLSRVAGFTWKQRKFSRN